MSVFPARRSTTSIVLMLAPLLFAAKCKRCGGPDETGTVETDTDTDNVQDVSVPVQVASIVPNEAEPGTPVKAMVYGSGFETGATVSFDNWDGGMVSVVDANTIRVTVPAVEAGSYDVIVQNPDGKKSTLRSGFTFRGDVVAECRYLTVYFDTDRAGLTSESKQEIADRLECYQRAAGTFRIEGHADERGTTDYNLALGQRRADSVKRYLAGLGLSPVSIDAVSYGEERPVDKGHSEAAWSKNRRAEIEVRD